MSFLTKLPIISMLRLFKRSNLALLILCLCALSASAQKKKKKTSLRDFSITYKTTLKKSGAQVFLKEVISDSRCPEGSECIWAGEAQVLVSVYKNGKWTDESIITFTAKNADENKTWLAQTLSIPVEKIKSLSLLPRPKSGVKTSPKSYSIFVDIQ